jgi:L-ribulokinase
MPESYLIGLDFGSESARGVLIETASGRQCAYHVHPYRHGIMTRALPNGGPLPVGYALQNGLDYLEAAEVILKAIGDGRDVAAIGVDFTASSPLPSLADGRCLSEIFPDEPHAYVKLWKHASAQAYADAINQRGGAFLDNFGGKVSGEWMLAKAAQIFAESPQVWRRCERFIESGDWLVWRLTGREARSLDFAAYKAQFIDGQGYPADVVEGLADRLSTPVPVGSAVGALTGQWRARTGVRGEAVVAVAVIDSHVVLPAVGAQDPGVLMGALGTSAGYLVLDAGERPMPKGIEGRAFGAALPGLWCYEAGQAAFGDVLAWFVRAFPRSGRVAEDFALYNREAAALPVRSNSLVALDWWNGNRVPYGDNSLRGLIAGFDLTTTAVDMYRALMDSICFGARAIVDRVAQSGVPIQRVVLTSGLAKSNPFLLQVMADVLGQTIFLPELENPTCVGAAIHAAVAAGVYADFRSAGEKLGARQFSCFEPAPKQSAIYETLYRDYCALSGDELVRGAVRRKP